MWNNKFERFFQKARQGEEKAPHATKIDLSQNQGRQNLHQDDAKNYNNNITQQKNILTRVIITQKAFNHADYD